MNLFYVRRSAVLMIGCALAGCAPEPPPAPVAPVTVKVTANTYCHVMRRIYGASGPTWDLADTSTSIDGLRRSAAAFRASCVSASTRNPTS